MDFKNSRLVEIQQCFQRPLGLVPWRGPALNPETNIHITTNITILKHRLVHTVEKHIEDIPNFKNNSGVPLVDNHWQARYWTIKLDMKEFLSSLLITHSSATSKSMPQCRSCSKKVLQFRSDRSNRLTFAQTQILLTSYNVCKNPAWVKPPNLQRISRIAHRQIPKIDKPWQCDSSLRSTSATTRYWKLLYPIKYPISIPKERT